MIDYDYLATQMGLSPDSMRAYEASERVPQELKDFSAGVQNIVQRTHRYDMGLDEFGNRCKELHQSAWRQGFEEGKGERE